MEPGSAFVPCIGTGLHRETLHDWPRPRSSRQTPRKGRDHTRSEAYSPRAAAALDRAAMAAHRGEGEPRHALRLHDRRAAFRLHWRWEAPALKGAQGAVQPGAPRDGHRVHHADRDTHHRRAEAPAC